MFGRVVVENGVKKVVPLTADCGSGNPCGAIITVYQNTVPNGYLPLGVQYDTTQFPVLYSILGTDTIPTASALGLPTLTTGQYIIKATSGINENQADNVLCALTPVDTVASGNMHSVTSNAVANYTVDRIEVNESRPASSNAVAEAINVIPYNKFQKLSTGADMNDCVDPAIIYYNSSTTDCNSFINRPTFTGGGEMAVFTIPLGSIEYIIQIYIAKESGSRSIAHRIYSSGNWSSWVKILDTFDDDDNIVNITGEISVGLGVSNVVVYKKGNTCYMDILGQYTGVQTAETQIMCTGIPSRYIPKVSQTFGVVSYRGGTPVVIPSRIHINTDGTISLDETAMETGDYIRFGFHYILN